MPETLEKLRPDRDLQCFYFQPSAIAAMSGASAAGFTVSGTWRQQFDWAVIEWNRDNVFEHPAFRNLPDGDLTGLTLTYDEERTNCIPMDSSLFPTVDWPSLRVWTDAVGDGEDPYFIYLRDGTSTPPAVPIEGSYQTAYADFTLSGSPAAGDIVGLAHMYAHYTYEVQSGDTLEDILDVLEAAMQASDTSLVHSVKTGMTIRVYFTNGADTLAEAVSGHNGNRFSMYTYSTGSAVWDAASKTFANGTSPTKWRVTLDFSSFAMSNGGPIPDSEIANIRKMRWTYAAAMQPEEFMRTEFSVAITNWSVTGTGRDYEIAGPGSRRIEENDPLLQYTGTWADPPERGNYSGGMIQKTSVEDSSVTLQYTMGQTHTLYVGTRYTQDGALISAEVDSSPAGSMDTKISGEDVLIRWPVGQYAAGTHTITVKHDDSSGGDFWFDFIEMAVPETELPEFPSQPNITLATDWDTLHSVAIAPERTAWMLDRMGFHGRQNHYVGALIFYELFNPDNQFATGTITFGGTATPNSLVSVTLSIGSSDTVVERVIHGGDTPTTIAQSFADEFNNGYTTVWASSSGGVLTLQSRLLGDAGNDITISVDTNDPTLTISESGLSGGMDGLWRTDLTASPRLNRAMRDWTQSFAEALDGYGIDMVCAFSTELKDVDPDPSVGMVQRAPLGDAIKLPTPSYQTNFSPTSINYWKEVYLECAAIMDAASIQPFLQFGEVQWWYFPDDGTFDPLVYSGMPFYDDWTKAEFLSQYSRPLPEFTTNDADPLLYSDEVSFLQSVLGDYTDQIMAYVSATYTNTRFEVLYPYDVNQTDFNKVINYPVASWTPAALDILKTEGLRFTFERELEMAEEGIEMGVALGFDADQRAHLIGVADATAPWLKESYIASGKGFESVAYFALDQYCLIGLPLPLPSTPRRSFRFRR